MGGEERLRAELLFVGDKFQYGTGDAHAVEGGGAAPDFVENEETVRRGVFEDVGDFVHLDHKGGLSRREVIGSAHAGENAVHHADFGAADRYEAPALRHEGNDGDLPHIGGLARHIGTGDNGDAVVVVVEIHVVGDKLFFRDGFHNRVAAVFENDLAGRIDQRTGVIVAHGNFGEGTPHIETGDSVGGLLYAVLTGCDLFADILKQIVFQLDHSVPCAQHAPFHFL